MKRALGIAILLSVFLATTPVEAARSGSSFGGGFRSSGRSSGLSRSYSSGRSYGGGSNFIFLPSFGWGGGWGYGGGFGGFGSLLMVGIVCMGAVMVVRSIRRASQHGPLTYGSGPYDRDELEESPDRAYVYKVQLGIGRSGRALQRRLEEFASTGDTSSEAGLAELLRQTGLELLREKDSIRYALVEPSGPFSLTNGETKLNGAAMAERSRFQVERVRGAHGKVHRSQAEASVSLEVLEYLVVTVLVATRAPLGGLQAVEDRKGLESVLGELGAVPASALLGLEVIWTPADPDDSLTETDLMTTYPEMRSL
jgi:uncharacterized membrane protein